MLRYLSSCLFTLFSSPLLKSFNYDPLARRAPSTGRWLREQPSCRRHEVQRCQAHLRHRRLIRGWLPSCAEIFSSRQLRSFFIFLFLLRYRVSRSKFNLTTATKFSSRTCVTSLTTATPSAASRSSCQSESLTLSLLNQLFH